MTLLLALLTVAVRWFVLVGLLYIAGKILECFLFD
jgi:hypothetical protein